MFVYTCIIIILFITEPAGKIELSRRHRHPNPSGKRWICCDNNLDKNLRDHNSYTTS